MSQHTNVTSSIRKRAQESSNAIARMRARFGIGIVLPSRNDLRAEKIAQRERYVKSRLDVVNEVHALD